MGKRGVSMFISCSDAHQKTAHDILSKHSTIQKCFVTTPNLLLSNGYIAAVDEILYASKPFALHVSAGLRVSGQITHLESLAESAVGDAEENALNWTPCKFSGGGRRDVLHNVSDHYVLCACRLLLKYIESSEAKSSKDIVRAAYYCAALVNEESHYAGRVNRIARMGGDTFVAACLMSSFSDMLADGGLPPIKSYFFEKLFDAAKVVMIGEEVNLCIYAASENHQPSQR